MGKEDNTWNKRPSGEQGQQASGNRKWRQKRDMAEPTDKSQAPATIHKGIYLSALIYIEGDQAPAENFNALAKAALKDRLAGKNSPEYAGLTMSLKKVEEQTDVEDDGNGKGADSGKFEF